MTLIDDDIFELSISQLREEIQRTRKALRAFRDKSGHELCWLNRGELFRVLPEHKDIEPVIPPRHEFLRECSKYQETLELVKPCNQYRVTATREDMSPTIYSFASDSDEAALEYFDKQYCMDAGLCWHRLSLDRIDVEELTTRLECRC